MSRKQDVEYIKMEIPSSCTCGGIGYTTALELMRVQIEEKCIAACAVAAEKDRDRMDALAGAVPFDVFALREGYVCIQTNGEEFEGTSLREAVDEMLRRKVDPTR